MVWTLHFELFMAMQYVHTGQDSNGDLDNFRKLKREQSAENDAFLNSRP